VPLIVGHLAQNASTQQGADALNNALGEHAGFHISDVLNGILSGSSGQGIGGAILGHIFGNNQSAASGGLGQVTGLGQQNSSQLMAILAPIVMAALANHVQSQGGGLGNVLAQEARRVLPVTMPLMIDALAMTSAHDSPLKRSACTRSSR